MIKVITYGTYDVLHYGHIRLLERAKALGDYLIVGVTSDDYDKTRGKINNQQSLMERIDAVKKLGIADEIIIEEYEGQKIDDIKKYNVDIFTVGSDWEGKFDYLNEFCKVIYLPRTDGISSSQIRSKKRSVKLAIMGDEYIANKYLKESLYVNGLESEIIQDSEYETSIDRFDAIYIITGPKCHYSQIKYALNKGKHVLCECPLTLSIEESVELLKLAKEKKCVLMDGIKTAFSTAYNRLVLQIKSGRIGKVISIDATCTSMREMEEDGLSVDKGWNSIYAWGPTALLPVFQILGFDVLDCKIVSKYIDKDKRFDGFSKIDLLFKNSVANIKVAKAAKSEGELVITGTKGYIYVPSPWWKTDYYEIRYEDQTKNVRQFYQLDGEGIRAELICFLKRIQGDYTSYQIEENISLAIIRVMQKFSHGKILEIN